MSYPHNEIDKKWQAAWQQAQCFKVSEDPAKPKFYALDMFPYPSGIGLHVGHLASYTPTDIVARYKRSKGFQVLHPMGYDAFGLPAEQYAIQTGIHPAETTRKAIENFRRQLKSFGYSFDWDREISTCEPDYYKWTQFIFLKLFEKGLAYQKEVPVNWCPDLRTVLANDEVIDGKAERGGHPVVRVLMKQWMLKITDYAERLLEGLERVDWPERAKEGQRNWIGKSEGASVRFKLEGRAEHLEVFTTRPDTIFGVTFMVLAPEHPLVKTLTSAGQKGEVQSYLDQTARKSEVERKAATDKTGVWTGGYALNPLKPDVRIPVWIADYVLMDYGTGAIMAVPGHDVRDFEFASKFKLPIVRVLDSEQALPFEGDGQLVNSQFLNGLKKSEAVQMAIKELETKGLGTARVHYKLRDWLFSRQRYWGEPFPIVHMEKTGIRGVAPGELPVVLPSVADYQPTEKGEPPLARSPQFLHYTDPQTGEKGRRETDTMPGSAASSWYFLRFTDPHNSSQPFAFAAQKYWMPVDLYIGGPEHTVGHLLYARFWQKVLFDAGLVSHDEPFLKLAHQGDILGNDGFRMSKSRGNGINPDEVRELYGADATRLYISFLGPFDKSKPWSTSGIEGVHRFLDRAWRLVVDNDGINQILTNEVPPSLNKLLHKTIKKVGDDLETLNFNTAISALMILINELYSLNVKPRTVLLTFTQLLAPLAPHIAEELWSRLGGSGFVSLAPWPAFNPDLAVADLIQMGVQVNGKTRGTIEIATTASADDAVALARAQNGIKNALDGKKVAKIIYKPGKILNIILQERS